MTRAGLFWRVLKAIRRSHVDPLLDSLTGDHLQLRAGCAHEALGREYHLDLSLFERMVNNGVHCVTLNTQHRMRPEVRGPTRRDSDKTTLVIGKAH